MDRGVDPDVGLPLEKLRAEGALFGQRQPQGIAIKLDRPANVVHEDRDTIQRWTDRHGYRICTITRFATIIPRAMTPASSSNSPPPTRISTCRLPLLVAAGC